MVLPTMYQPATPLKGCPYCAFGCVAGGAGAGAGQDQGGRAADAQQQRRREAFVAHLSRCLKAVGLAIKLDKIAKG